MKSLHPDGLRPLLARAAAVTLASVGVVVYLHLLVAGLSGPDATSLLASGLVAIGFVFMGRRTPADGASGTALMLFAVVVLHVGGMLVATLALETQLTSQLSGTVLAVGSLLHLGAGLALAGTLWDVPLPDRWTGRELPDGEPVPERRRGHPADD